MLTATLLLPLSLGESARELSLHTFEGHTPSSTQWEVVNLNAVSGKKDLDSAWKMGQTVSAAACQDACGANATCTAFAWAAPTSMPAHNCGLKSDCFFRADRVWEPKPLTGCNFTSGRKVVPTPAPTPRPPPVPPLGYQPNIVFVLTDDQDTRLGREDYTDIGSLEVMPQLQKHLMAGGARFRNAFVNTPICCPSRTEFFSGRYFHNVGPPNDPGSCMHADTTQAARNDTGLFGLMKGAGYQVGIFGKVTNDAGPILKLLSSERSASWISSPVDYNSYDGLPYWRDWGNGSAPYTETLDKKDPVYGTVYQTTQIGNRTLDWLDALHADPATAGKPFFAYVRSLLLTSAFSFFYLLTTHSSTCFPLTSLLVGCHAGTSGRTRRTTRRSRRPGTSTPSTTSPFRSPPTTTARTRARRSTRRRTRRSRRAPSAGRTSTSATAGPRCCPWMTSWARSSRSSRRRASRTRPSSSTAPTTATSRDSGASARRRYAPARCCLY